MVACPWQVGRRKTRSSKYLIQDQDRKCATGLGEPTIVSKLFEGTLSYVTVCMRCDHQTHNTQTFTVLSLPIPTHISKCSIQVHFLDCGHNRRCSADKRNCNMGSKILTFLVDFSSLQSVHLVQDCLSLFFEQTLLTGAEKMLCSACELRKETALVTCLDKPPEILVLHLKRSVGSIIANNQRS